MKERGIIFSAPMVKALLAGRKTQTRRLTKGHQFTDAFHATCLDIGVRRALAEMPDHVHAPYASGDRLWVRETWAPFNPEPGEHGVAYRASCDDSGAFDYVDLSGCVVGLTIKRWKSPIFMPRWASRITLEVIGVRVERLKDISEADACAEGIGSPVTRDCKVPQFAELWDEIQKRDFDRWANNPWVWVVSFRVVRP